MDFRPTDDQRLLQESVRDYLTGTHGAEVLRGLDNSPSRRSPAVWQGLVDMGLTGLLVPQAQGGLGLTLVDAALVATELGRAGVAEPLADSALIAAPILKRAGVNESLLELIADGSARIALDHPINPWVADLDGASHLLVADSGALGLALVTGVSSRLESIDPLRRLHQRPPVHAAAINGTADMLLDHAALIRAAELIGLGEAMLDMSTAYARDRKQFGQPIGSFQAVKHQLATIAVKVGFARPVVLRAAIALDQGQASASAHVSHAKLAAGEAAWAAAETAIQVYGAMGYTYEVDLHFWMKRVWALAGAWGDRAFHLRRLDQDVIGGMLPIGPANTFV